jgi:hypothetical protein
MAKVTGPLMSMTASGTVGKVATFSIWKGIAYVRNRVIPKNPMSTLQKAARSALGTIAKACAAVLTITMDTAVPAIGSPFFTAAVAAAPSGQSWISYLQKILNNQFTTLVAAYGTASGVHAYFVESATDIGLADYVDKSGTTHTNGQQLYLLAAFAVQQLGYTGFAAGINSATLTQTDAFSLYVHATT